MGYIVRIKCNKCKIDESLKVGQGIKDFEKERVVSYFSDSAKIEAEKILNSGKLFTFENVIGFCSKCKNYSSYPSLIYFEGDKERRLTDKCKCGEKPTVEIDSEILEETSSIECKKCGGTLEIEVKNLFD